MNTLSNLYRHSLALLTDLYELTMAYGYWKLGLADREAAFHVVFRRNPFGSGYAVACGLSQAVDFIQNFRFEPEDLDYLRTVGGNDGRPIFSGEFLDYLAKLHLRITLDAMPEGTVAFPQEPLVRVTGPLLQAQIIESALLAAVNFQTLIATKAARICQAAGSAPVIEFGLRRAQGYDGGITARRAAFVGGCAGTSNTLAGKLFDIPVMGTHAHSWVLVFDDELEAFRSYAQTMPNNCVFLVDTYDTLKGVRHAATAAQELRGRGHEMTAVRLDSGDLAYLSTEARMILDSAGLPDAGIVASGELDEHVIASLREQQAPIGLWGVGTRLATAWDDPALGGVYKLTAVRNAAGNWQHKIKLSEQIAKITTPGILRVRRFSHDGEFIADAIYDELLGLQEPCEIVDPVDPTRRKRIPPQCQGEDLLVRVFDRGRQVYWPPASREARRRTAEQLGHLHPGIRRLLNPHQYPAGLEQRLHELRTRMIAEAREAVGK